MISQGGAGSSYQALAAGCPLFLLPSHQNHQVLTDIICDLNLGVDIGVAPDSLENSPIDFKALSRNVSEYSNAVATENGAEEIAKQVYRLI